MCVCACALTHMCVFRHPCVFFYRNRKKSNTFPKGSAELLGRWNLACGELSGRLFFFCFFASETTLPPLLCTRWFLPQLRNSGLICSHLCCLQLSTTSAHGSSLARDTLPARGGVGIAVPLS